MSCGLYAADFQGTVVEETEVGREVAPDRLPGVCIHLPYGLNILLLHYNVMGGGLSFQQVVIDTCLGVGRAETIFSI